LILKIFLLTNNDKIKHYYYDIDTNTRLYRSNRRCSDIF